MLRISRDGYLAKWAYLTDYVAGEDYLPRRTNICTLFWRSVVLTPMALAAALTLLGGIVYFLWMYPFEALVSVGTILVGIGYCVILVLQRREFGPDPDTLWAKHLIAKKKKLCLVVEIW